MLGMLLSAGMWSVQFVFWPRAAAQSGPAPACRHEWRLCVSVVTAEIAELAKLTMVAQWRKVGQSWQCTPLNTTLLAALTLTDCNLAEKYICIALLASFFWCVLFKCGSWWSFSISISEPRFPPTAVWDGCLREMKLHSLAAFNTLCILGSSWNYLQNNFFINYKQVTQSWTQIVIIVEIPELLSVIFWSL